MKKIATDIYTVSIQTEKNSYYSYLLKDGDNFTLVDPGPDSDEVKEFWELSFRNGLRINRIIMTNSLSLSVSNAISKLWNVPIISTKWIDRDEEYLASYGITSIPTLTDQITVEQIVESGDTLRVGAYEWTFLQVFNNHYILQDEKEKLCLVTQTLDHSFQCVRQEDEYMISRFFDYLQSLVDVYTDYKFIVEDQFIRNINEIVHTTKQKCLQLLKKLYNLLYNETTIETLTTHLSHENPAYTLALLHYLVEIKKVEVNKNVKPYTFKAIPSGFESMVHSSNLFNWHKTCNRNK